MRSSHLGHRDLGDVRHDRSTDEPSCESTHDLGEKELPPIFCDDLDDDSEQNEKREGVEVEFESVAIGGKWRDHLKDDLRHEVDSVPKSNVLCVEGQFTINNDGTKLGDKAWLSASLPTRAAALLPLFATIEPGKLRVNPKYMPDTDTAKPTRYNRQNVVIVCFVDQSA
jgi:hypothetical protein